MTTQEIIDPCLRPLSEYERRVGENATTRLSKKAIESARYPRHWGEMADPDCTAQHRGSCGDVITYYLRLQDERIRQIRFTTTGCDATYAAANMLAAMVRGLSLQEAEKVSPEDLLEALEGLPPKHIHCATLSVVTLQQAIQACRQKKAQP